MYVLASVEILLLLVTRYIKTGVLIKNIYIKIDAIGVIISRVYLLCTDNVKIFYTCIQSYDHYNVTYLVIFFPKISTQIST